MAYSELVKQFDRIRDYMRDFLIFGFKTREAFGRHKSTRTYDNERRRIESWLGDSLRWEYHSNGKAVFLSVDASQLEENPLYRAWRSKSFTDNDIMLHFFLLDVLADGIPRRAEEFTDALLDRYGEQFDPQTVRRKLNEYTHIGLLSVARKSRCLYYRQSPLLLESLLPDPDRRADLLSFFSEAAPFSVVGSFLKERDAVKNRYFRFKHHFIVHTLEDQILMAAIEAIHNNHWVEITNVSGRDGHITVTTALPAKILVSTQTGRRYLLVYRPASGGFSSLRLDYIKALQPLSPSPAGLARPEGLESCLAHTWGASISANGRLQRLRMTLEIDESTESYVIDRLEREGRGGTVTRIGPNCYEYLAEVYDINEMLPWIKTFTGRILSLEGDNKTAINRFYRDMQRMAGLYGVEV